MTPDLLFRRPPAEGPWTEIVSPQNAPLKWLRVGTVHLTAQSPEWTFETGDAEAALDIFGGLCTVNIHSSAGDATFPEIGKRAHVFAGKPTMVYIPRDSRVSLYAEGAVLDAALIFAPARQSYPAAVIYPEETITREVGRDNWSRTVVTAIGDNVRADRLIIGETFNPPGNWSSSPPHKHDRQNENETPMEEVYLYKTSPPGGFGLQRIYTAPDDPEPFDVTYAVQDGDAVVLPRGYHPVVAAPGYQLFYLWALAGEERRYGAWANDPAHAWILEETR